MPKVKHPHPSIQDENDFHSRNSEIVQLQLKLTNGASLPYSIVHDLTTSIDFMRQKNRAFNTNHGLNKEIA